MKLNETKKMNEDFVCPDCKGSLRLDHNNKSLNCEHHGQFTIKNGIPSFCNSKDFDFHWDDNQLDKISQQKIDVALDFLKPVFQSISNKNKISRILDAGCGDGVHAHVLDKFDSSIKSSKYYGMDISYPGLVLAKSRIQNKTNFCFIHGDIQKLPFEDNFFDTVISFGVLAYTDDPFLSFCELNRVTKKKCYDRYMDIS